MKKLISIFLFCCMLIIVTFLLFGDVEKWVEINLNSRQSLLTYTLFSFGILTSDIVLPIPSSLVMILNGKMLGVLFGTMLSLVSGVFSSSIGFYLGRSSNSYIDRLFNAQEKEVSNKLFKKFGNTAITISKTLPIVSETISFVSGTTSITFKTFLTYSIAGHFIVSIIYAFVGDFSTSLSSNFVAAIVIILALLIGWAIQVALKRKNA